jgi:peptide/nickel transport system permease protein
VDVSPPSQRIDAAPTAFVGVASETAALGIPVRTRVGEVGRRFFSNRLAVLGLVMVSVLFLTAALAPVLAPADPMRQDLVHGLRGPSWQHPFGTDLFGRDQLSRVIYGSRIAAVVGLLSVPLALLVAVLVGSVAGVAGRCWDTILMRVADMFYAFPFLIGLIVVVLVLGRGVTSVILAIGMFGWATMARVLRSSILSVREAHYVEAARSLGASRWRVVTRHVLPNSLTPVLVMAVVRVGTAVLALAGLSFLGIGVEPDAPDWGTMVAAGSQFFGSKDYLWLFPSLAVVFAVLGFVFVGDGLRAALDPKTGGRQGRRPGEREHAFSRDRRHLGSDGRSR